MTYTNMRILLIEDNRATAAYIVDGLRRSGHVVDHASCGEDGLVLLDTVEYDVLICDILLPDLNGFDLVKQLRQKNSQLPVLFLSSLDAVENRVKGLEIGGDDYLVKPFSFSELLARIHALKRRAVQMPEQEQLQVLEMADLKLDLLRVKAYRGSQDLMLQPLEFRLLHYLMRNAGRVLSKTLIMEKMWDLNFNPDSNVVEVRMHHLRSKVDKPFSNKLIHTVRGIGYVLEDRST